MDLEGIDHLAMSVADPKGSAQWYIDVLGFEHRFQGMWNGVPIFVGKGTTAIALFPSNAGPAGEDSSGPRMLHLAFRTSGEGFKTAQRELQSRGIPFQFQDHEISHSIYFQDPDGHKLEITTYELDLA